MKKSIKKNSYPISPVSHTSQPLHATCAYTMFSMIKEQTYKYVAKQVNTEFKVNK